MAWDFMQNGLLGMGGLGGGQQNMPGNALLGQFYDPAEMRKYQMKQMLLGLGAGLMAEKGFGKGAALALAAGDRAGQVYRDNAMDAYRIKSQQDQQAKEDKRYETEWAFRVKQADAEAARQREIDAQNKRLFGYKVAEQNRLEGQRQAQENYVTDWMQGQNQMGAGLPMSPGVRAIGRAGGVEGPSATDQWRFNNAAPFAGAQDYGNAFNQIAAQPPALTPPETRTVRRGNQQVTQEFDNTTGTWSDVAVGDAFKMTPDTQVNVNTSDNAFDKEAGGILAKRYGGIVEEGDKAIQMIGDIGALRDIGSQINTGKGTQVMAALGPYAEAMGIKIEGLGEAQAYEAIVARIAPSLRTPGVGSSSDFDARQFLMSLPQLGRTPEGNAIIQNTIEGVARYKQQAAAIAQQALLKKISPEEADRQIRALGDPWSLWKRAQKALPQQAPATAKPVNEMSDEELMNALGGQ